MSENKKIIHRSAALAAATALAYKGNDEVPLTTITIDMATQLCLKYGHNDTFATIMCSKALGKFAGEMILKKIASWIPEVGSIANATITFAIHEATGWAIVAKLEEEENNKINNIKEQ